MSFYSSVAMGFVDSSWPSIGPIQILRNALGGGRGSRILLRFVTSIGGGPNDHLLRNDFKFSKCLEFQIHHFLVISISLKETFGRCLLICLLTQSNLSIF